MVLIPVLFPNPQSYKLYAKTKISWWWRWILRRICYRFKPWIYWIQQITGTKMAQSELKSNSLRRSLTFQTIGMFTSVHFSLFSFWILHFSWMKTPMVTYESCSGVCSLVWRKKLHAGDTDVYLCLDDERCVCIFCDECEREHKIFKKHSVDPKEGHFLVSGSSLRLPRRLLIELMKWSFFSIWQWSKERCG